MTKTSYINKLLRLGESQQYSCLKKNSGMNGPCGSFKANETNCESCNYYDQMIDNLTKRFKNEMA